MKRLVDDLHRVYVGLDAMIAKGASAEEMRTAAAECEFYGQELVDLGERLRVAAWMERSQPVKVKTNHVRRWVSFAAVYVLLADFIGFMPGLGIIPATSGQELHPLTDVGLLDEPTHTDLNELLRIGVE